MGGKRHHSVNAEIVFMLNINSHIVTGLITPRCVPKVADSTSHLMINHSTCTFDLTRFTYEKK